jgi:hypothetical protein
VPAYLPTFFRAVADKVPQLMAAYAASMTVGLLAHDFAVAHQLDVVAWLGELQFVVVLSIVFTTFALYRDDDLIPTAMLLTVIIAVGGIVALMIQGLVQTHSIFAAMVLAIVAPFTYFVRALVLIPGYVVLVWIARKLRRFLAPATVLPPDGAA